jgi:predicted nucleotidyltransferase
VGVREKEKDAWMTLEEIKQVAVPACKEFKVKRLDLFGSHARGAGATASDVDLLVEFAEPDLRPAKRFFGLLHHLEDVERLIEEEHRTNGCPSPVIH